MNEAARKSRTPRAEDNAEKWDTQQDRWTRIINCGDAKTVWKSINWNGQLITGDNTTEPSDDEFKEHFETLLNPPDESQLEIDTSDCPTIPILDDPFTPMEVEHAMKKAKNKGFTGVATGLFRWITLPLLLYITQILTIIFTSANYPSLWCYNKLIVLFKSGVKSQCGNYRGISIMDSLSKIYDTLLNNRLTAWINIDSAQAGAQKGRGCVEQILALRLLFDYCLSRKTKMFVIFVDFKKAYDKVPRKKLLQCLKSQGCGKNMLLAISALYSCTKFILKSATISACIGVRQGAPTSCLLFVLYIDKLVRDLKERFQEDGFLGSVHALLLMDDTVIMATTRGKAEEKMNTLLTFCNESGMALNELKTKFMVVNGGGADKEPLETGGVVIGYTSKYVYLGAHFTDDGRMKSVIKLHAERCTKHANKFGIFIRKNQNMPYHLKLKVFNAALISAMLYGCETWLTNNLVSVSKHYMTCLKLLLGVRTTTPNELCMIEAHQPEMASIIMKRRCGFINNYLEKATGDEPLIHIFELCKNANTKMYKLLQTAKDYHGDPTIHSMESLKRKCRMKQLTSTRMATYLEINPELSDHKIYTDPTCYVPDQLRISFTRLRLSSHRLRVETGRWTRIPREQRVCSCDRQSLQDEVHVLLNCTLTNTIRTKYDIRVTSIKDLLDIPTKILCTFINNCLNVFE